MVDLEDQGGGAADLIENSGSSGELSI